MHNFLCWIVHPSALASVNYDIVVYTGDKFGAGTNANVHVTLYGEHGNTGKRELTQSMRNLFERKQVDKFTIEAVDLGTYVRLHFTTGDRKIFIFFYRTKCILIDKTI